MKKITNTSKRVISLNGKVVMPDESIMVKDEIAALGSVKAIAKYNGLKIEDVVEAAAAATETATKKTTKKATEAAAETVTEG